MKFQIDEYCTQLQIFDQQDKQSAAKGFLSELDIHIDDKSWSLIFLHQLFQANLTSINCSLLKVTMCNDDGNGKHYLSCLSSGIWLCSSLSLDPQPFPARVRSSEGK